MDLKSFVILSEE